MAQSLSRFHKNDMMFFKKEPYRHDLAMSVGPDTYLHELLNGDNSDKFADLPLAYSSTAGYPPLRDKIATSHGVKADDVIITVGGMHAVFLISFILCRPDDEVVTTSLLYPNARSVLETIGASIKTLDVTFDAAYRIDVPAFRALLSPNTKLVSLASPQNPSGVLISPQDIQDIASLMNEICPSAYLLVDETYREAVYGDNTATSTVVGLGPKLISCASLSKCHGAPGLRIGWAITRDKALQDQLLVGKHSTVISCSLVDELLALRVLEQSDRIIGERRQQLYDNLERTAAWVGANEDLVEWIKPDAGAICCIRLQPSKYDNRAIARFYDELRSAEARVANSVWFGGEPRVFRLGFGAMDPAGLDSALSALTTALHRALQS